MEERDCYLLLHQKNLLILCIDLFVMNQLQRGAQQKERMAGSSETVDAACVYLLASKIIGTFCIFRNCTVIPSELEAS